MKTYYIFLGLFTGLLLSCSTTDDSDNQNNNIEVSDYAVVLQNGNSLTVQLLNATSNQLTLNSAESIFSENTLPDLKYVEGVNQLHYYATESCSGLFKRHNFKNDVSEEIVAFNDLNNCDLEVTAIIESSKNVYVSYVLNSEDPVEYHIRSIDLNSSNFSFVDVSLDKKPIDFAFSNDQLYVLTLDEQITDEHSLSVFDLNTLNTIDELNLGYDALRIFMNAKGELIIGYEELHGVVNTSSLEISYVQYTNGFTPKFAYSDSRNFGNQGKLYYPSNPEANSTYPLVPTSYDFIENQETIFAFEALLSEEQQNEFLIKKTTSVNFDTDYDMILIGYEKTDGINGGLVRIRINDKNEVSQIDQVSLDGIPTEIFIR